MSNNHLIETIRIQKGRVRQIAFHNARCNRSRKLLFGSEKPINLRSIIDTSLAKDPLVKCRITYNDEIQRIEYLPYAMKQIRSLKTVEIGDLKYSHKYSDRNQLKVCFDQRGSCDDILMTKNGVLTDSYYANIALSKNGTWYTPTDPLLKGTMRSYLLSKGLIKPKKINIENVLEYESIRLFNAMISFGSIEFSTRNIK